MSWGTQNDVYGSFHQEWRRVPLQRHTPENVRGNLRNRENTTSHEYGNWFRGARGDPMVGRHPPARYGSPFVEVQRQLATPRTADTNPPGAVLLPPIPYKPVRKPAPKANTDSGAQTQRQQRQQSTINLPEVKAIDVQLLTANNALVSIAPSSSGVYKYSYPRSVNDVALPDIKEINVKFLLKNNKSVAVRAKPDLSEE